MRLGAVIYYSEGEQEAPLAILVCSGDRIDYRLCEDSPAIPFGLDERERIVRNLIELPLRVSRLRHKTMPQLFDELRPGSEEHLCWLQRTYGSFRVGLLEAEA
jgi:hypothetical protein